MTYLKEFLNTIKTEPVIFVAGVSVLLLAVMGTSVRHVASSTFAILVLLSFITVKDWRSVYISLSSLEKLFLLSFLLYMISGVLSYYNADDIDKYVKLFERYFRFLLVIPLYLFLVKKKRSLLKYLYTGVVISGPFLFLIALNHSLKYPDVPAQGDYHHIIFGQLAMLNVGIMLSMLFTLSLSAKIRTVILISVLCGVATAIMSQARGAWLVIPVYLAFIIYSAMKSKKIGVATVIIFILLATALSSIGPVGDVVKQRTSEAITEVNRFYTEDQYISSVGTRLAMWEIAVDVWKKNPVVGTGPGDFDDEVMELQKEGKYVGMDVHNSVHNIYLQALVGSGLVGLLALLITIVLIPILVFINMRDVDKGASYAGIIMVVSYAIFGLTESWTLRLPAVSVFLVYLVVMVSHLHVSRLNKDKVQGAE